MVNLTGVAQPAAWTPPAGRSIAHEGAA
jgi:hypothetical protein